MITHREAHPQLGHSMTRKLGKMPCLRDAIAVIDEDNLNSGGSATTKAAAAPLAAPTPPAAARSATSLAPGPMGLEAVSAANLNSAQTSSWQCSRCKGYGNRSPVCPSPRNWKWGDPVAGSRRPGTSSGPTGSLRGGGSGAARARGRAAKGSQAHNTEIDHDSDVSAAEEEGALEDDDGETESGSGKV